MFQRVIVTGATGTIGVALVNKLLQENMEIIVLVNPHSARICRLPEDRRVSRVPCAIEDMRDLGRERLGKCDALFHLAWRGTTGVAREDMYLQNSNVEYALDAVGLAERCGCEVFLGAGSQAEYGRAEGMLSAKTPTCPETGYGMGKLCAGHMTRGLCKRLGIRHIWTRILSVYGPCDSESSMIISGIRAMLRRERAKFTRGEQLWDYLHCEDAANALYLAALKGKDGSVYPVGSGKAVPLKDYIECMRETVEHIIGKSVEVELGGVPYGPRQMMYLCADIAALTRDTGFIPRVSFGEGIQQTVLWCRENDEIRS